MAASGTPDEFGAAGRHWAEIGYRADVDYVPMTAPVMPRDELAQIAPLLPTKYSPLHPGKCDIRIFDYVDRDVPMLLHIFEKRLRGYRVIGYARRARGAILSTGWTIVGQSRISPAIVSRSAAPHPPRSRRADAVF